MASRRWKLTGAAAAALAVALFAQVASAQDQWTRNKGDCEYVLRAPERYPLPSVQECVMLWEQYRDVSTLSPDEKSLYARGPSWLFVYGDANQKSVANSALTRMGKTQPLVFNNDKWTDPNNRATTGPLGANPDDNVATLQPLPPVTPRKAGKGAQRKANKLNTQGFRLYKKRNYPGATSKFEQALEHDPFYVKAKFNLACNQSLAGDTDGALRTLLELQSWQDSEAQAAFQRARIDKDFEPLHGDKRFRTLLGLVRLQILNGAGEPGLFHVGRIYKAFQTRNYAVHQYGYDRHIRKRPLIFFREGYERQAQLAKDIVQNPRTAVKKIHWESPFDLIVVWGDPDVARQSGATGPVVQGTATGDKDDDPLGSVLDAANKVKEKGGEVNDAVKEPPPLPGQ